MPPLPPSLPSSTSSAPRGRGSRRVAGRQPVSGSATPVNLSDIENGRKRKRERGKKRDREEEEEVNNDAVAADLPSSSLPDDAVVAHLPSSTSSSSNAAPSSVSISREGVSKATVRPSVLLLSLLTNQLTPVRLVGLVVTPLP